MRKHLFIALVFSFNLFFAQDNNLISSSSKDGKYSIKHMKNWNVVFQNNGAEISMTVPLKNIDNIPGKITLSKEENLPKDFNQEMLTTRNTLLITKFLKASTVDNGSADFNGSSAYWVTYVYEINETPFKGLSYFFIHNNIAYQMTIAAPESDFQTLEVLFRQIGESVVVK